VRLFLPLAGDEQQWQHTHQAAHADAHEGAHPPPYCARPLSAVSGDCTQASVRVSRFGRAVGEECGHTHV
jgi:hypothetical protein